MTILTVISSINHKLRKMQLFDKNFCCVNCLYVSFRKMILPVKHKWLECPIKYVMEMQFLIFLLNKTRNQ